MHGAACLVRASGIGNGSPRATEAQTRYAQQWFSGFRARPVWRMPPCAPVPALRAGAERRPDHGVDQRYPAPHAAAASDGLRAGAGIAVPVAGRATAGEAFGRFAFAEVQYSAGSTTRELMMGGVDFESATGFQRAAHMSLCICEASIVW